jgi:hypothetical protein
MQGDHPSAPGPNTYLLPPTAQNQQRNINTGQAPLQLSVFGEQDMVSILDCSEVVGKKVLQVTHYNDYAGILFAFGVLNNTIVRKIDRKSGCANRRL